MLAALERHGVAFVAVGQLAAQWQGAGRVTKDFDICPAWRVENLDHVAAALRDLGARLKVPQGPVEGVEVPVDAAFLRRLEVGAWRTTAGDLDVLMGIPWDSRWNLARYEQLRDRAVLVEIGDVTVMAAALDDIVRSKEIADPSPGS